MPFSPNMQKRFNDMKDTIEAWVETRLASVDGGRSTHNVYYGTSPGFGDSVNAQIGDYFFDVSEKAIFAKTDANSWTVLGFFARNNFVWITNSGPPGTGESSYLHLGDYYINKDDGHVWWYSWMTSQWEDMTLKTTILKSPNGTSYRLKVANDGTLSTETV